MSPAHAVPYVVGQWVRGNTFYGRTTLIRDVLEGPRNTLWILGTRRVGKTSLLKELERLTRDGAKGYFPLFWDLQGSDEPEELHLGFADALLDAEERCAAAGFTDFEAAEGDLFTALNRLRRAVNARNLTLLLLCDEVEELINLNRKKPALLGKLRNAMQGREGVRTVISSTIRLWALSETIGDTSPFLHGFTPPSCLQSLTSNEAEALVRQDHLPAGDRPAIDEATVTAIASRTSCHPYLTQILAKRFLEEGELETASENVANDRMVSYFFSVDYEMLDARERRVLHLLAEQDGATSDSIGRTLGTASATVAQDLQRLTDLGFITRTAAAQYEISSFFFRRWLDDLSRRSAPGAADTSSLQGANSTPTHPVPLGTVADRYQLLQRVGEGASAIVYRAHDRLLDTTVAVKQFKPTYMGSEDGLDRLRKEILLARDLAHPHIVRIYDVGSHHERAFITMQWIDGPTLEAEIDARGPLPGEWTARVAYKLAGALWCAHQRNVLHRDIKPSNILLAGGEEPMLGDFGLARLIGDAGITSEGMFLGTPYYSSPEQANARPLDGRSDIYSLGVVMFEMATGKRPFEAETRQQVLDLHREAMPPDPRSINPALSDELAGVITRCLAKELLARFQSALELEEALCGLTGTPRS
jgi:tRNA A-37 threonylcarbamoyl transferase component Bud32/DNA-binding CsgD family transcriptional regulator